MFSIETVDFGSDKKIEVRSRSGIGMDILPDYGAALNALWIPNREDRKINIIDGYLHPDEPAKTGALYKSVVLFPFPNRLRNGAWEYQGKTLQFPVNEPARNNALHGMLYNRKFDIVETAATAEMAFVLLRFEQKEALPFYPFLFRLEVEYILTDTDGLSVKTRIWNTGPESMPCGLGWHPYFSTGTPVDEWILSAPDLEALEIDKQMIPTGIQTPYPVFQSPREFGATQLDTGFFLKEESTYSLEIQDPVQQVAFSVWQLAGKEGFGYVQLYSPPHRKSLAIEPMTCAANALATGKDGLFAVLPGESQVLEWGIRFR